MDNKRYKRYKRSFDLILDGNRRNLYNEMLKLKLVELVEINGKSYINKTYKDLPFELRYAALHLSCKSRNIDMFNFVMRYILDQKVIYSILLDYSLKEEFHYGINLCLNDISVNVTIEDQTKLLNYYKIIKNYRSEFETFIKHHNIDDRFKSLCGN